MSERPPATPKPQEQLEKELRQILADMTDEQLDAYTDFGPMLLKKYPPEECRKLRLFHLVIGSSPPDNTVAGDFEGEDSIEKFIRSLARKS